MLFSYLKRFVLQMGDGYTVELKEANEDSYKLFIDLGISIEALLEWWIYPIGIILRNELSVYTSTKDAPVFGFFTSENHVKIYAPYLGTRPKFMHIGKKPEDFIFGWDHLPENGKAIFICAGEKDTLLMSHVIGYPAISPNSENSNSNITKEHFEELKNRFSEVVVLFDNDPTGKKSATKMANKFGIRMMELPEMEKGKDLTDYVKNGYSVEELCKMIEDVIMTPDPMWGDDVYEHNTSVSDEFEAKPLIKNQEEKESINDNWPSEYFDTLNKILEKANESGYEFIEGARNEYIVHVAGVCNTKGLSLKFVEEQLNKRINLNNFDDHSKTLRGIYLRYESNFGKSPILEKEEHIKHETPTLNKEKLKKFPKIFKMLSKRFTDERERDVSIIGLLSLLGAILNGYNVIHQNKRYFTNLFSVIAAPFASGKGTMNVIRNIGNPLNRKLAEISKERYRRYQDELQYYKENSKDYPELEEPVMPILPRLFFGGDMSAASFKAKLADTGGSGMMFDTEADTITQTLSMEWGDYSGLLRKALTNESIDYDRKNESGEIPRPYVSGLISGTVGALLRLIPSSEDGLFSRLIYYVFDKRPVFAQDAFDYKLVDENENQEKEMAEIVKQSYFYFDLLREKNQSIEFYWDEKYQKELLLTFEGWLKSHLAIIGAAGSRVLFRLGNMATRIAAILTVFRLMEDGESVNPQNLDSLFESQSRVRITCCKDDFEATMHIMDVIRQHTFHVYENLSEDQQNKPLKALKTQQLNLWNALPKEFQRKEAVEVGEKLEIKERTVGKYLKILVDQKLAIRDEKGRYTKLL